MIEEIITVDDAWTIVQDVLNEKAELNDQNRAWFAELLRALTMLKQALTVRGLVEDDDAD